jgi:hypothetical protein
MSWLWLRAAVVIRTGSGFLAMPPMYVGHPYHQGTAMAPSPPEE